MADKPLKGIKFPGLDGEYQIPQIDNTLSVEGDAADAAATGAAIAASATKVVKIWQNAKWSQPFEAQSISWDEEQKFDAFIITFVYDYYSGYEQSFLTVRYENMQGHYICAYFPPKGFDRNITSATWRYATVSQTGVTFGKGYRDGAEDAYACIPNTVLGIKW